MSIDLGEFFRNTSVFSVMKRDPPGCFLEVERHFGLLIDTEMEAFSHPSLALAGNLCRRLANVEFYAGEIADLMTELTLGGQLLLGTRLVGYFGSCKSLLDAEIVDWRHSAVHRATPEVVAGLAPDPATGRYDFVGYTTASVHTDPAGEHVSPLYFYERWNGDLVTLSEEVCRDIIMNS